MDTKEMMCRRAVLELSDGAVVNLGIGIPTGVADYIPENMTIVLQSENGCLMIGPTPAKGRQNSRYGNAGGLPVTLLPGGTHVDLATSFGIIRGGHVDVTIMGALEVDQEGSLANWGLEVAPGKYSPGPGGAMDLVAAAKKVIVMMQHQDKKGNSKLRKKCTLALTGKSCLDLIITDKAVFSLEDGKLVLKETAPGLSVEDIKAITEADFAVAPDVCEYRVNAA